MELIQINQAIIDEIKTLVKARDSLRLRSEDKASAMAEYDKKLAQTMIQLKNGIKIRLDGEPIEYSSATGLERIAKGVCYKEKIKADLAETNYKSAVAAMDACKTIINAYQSMLKYVEEA